MPDVKFGLSMGVVNPLYPPEQQMANWAEMARVGRQVGFDSIAAPHHWLAHPIQWFQPLLVLARLAADAGPMRLVTGIIQLPLYNPVDMAEQVATLDVISGGRFTFGVGLGYREQLFEAAGARKADRVGRFVESIEVMRRLWSGEEVTFHGRHFRVTRGRLSLLPLQKPHPPIWAAGQSEPAVRRVGEMGLAWYIPPQADFHDASRLWKVYREALDRAGRPLPPDVPLLKYICVARDRKTAVDIARTWMADTFARYRPWGLQEATTVRIHRTFEEELERHLVGTPEECAEKLNRYVEAFGVNHIVFGLGRPNFKHEDVLDTLRLIGERLIPRVRGKA